MNILYILDYFSPHIGGVETLFSHITQQQVQQNNTVIVLTTKHDPLLASYEIINQVHIYRVGRTRMHWINMWIQGNKLIKQYQIDLIHTSTYSAAFPAWILQYQHNITHILHVHEVYGELWHRFLGLKAYCNRWFETLVVGLLPRDSYHCVSRYTLNSVRTHYKLPDEKLVLITNPLSKEFWKPYDVEHAQEIRISKIKVLEQRNPVILCATKELGKKHSWSKSIIGLYYGRTGVEKGLQLFIKSLPSIIQLYPSFHAIIIAPIGEPKPNRWSKRQTSYSLQQQIKQLGLENHITWLPPVNNKQEIKDWIAAGDIVILPSLTEGFGYAMHEVAMMNKRLVTTSVGGQIETLSEYNNIYWMKQVTSEEIVKGVNNLLGIHG